MADSGTDDSEKKPQQPPPIEFLRPGEQQAPPPPEQPAAWVPRPEDFQRPMYTAPPPAAPRGAGRLAVLAGVLLILAGILGFLYTFSVFMIVPTLQDFYNLTNQSPAEMAQNSILSIAIIYGQALAFVGGAAAVQRKNWKLAVACAGLSTLGIGILFLGTMLSVVALLILFRARPEFSS